MIDPPLVTVVPLPPSYRGGTEEYAYRLVERFSAADPVEVWTTTVRWDPAAPCLATGQAAVHRMTAREWFERPVVLSAKERRRLRVAIRRSRAVQIHLPFPGVEKMVVRSARHAGVPTVLTYHMDARLADVRERWGAGTVTELYRRFSAHPTLEEADRVVANSWGYARWSPVLSRHLSKVRVIPKGVDPLRLGLPSSGLRPRPPCVASSAVPPGRKNLLFVGRLVPYKGLPILLEALARISASGQDVGLLIAGRGPMADDLRRRAAVAGIADRVSFLGFVPDRDLGALYRFADLVVVASKTPLEATATSLEEAVACGTPVVGTALPGTDETVPNDGRTGLLVPPGDVDRLVLGIERMLSAERPATPTSFRTWDDVAADYAELLQELGAPLATGATPERSAPAARPSGVGAIGALGSLTGGAGIAGGSPALASAGAPFDRSRGLRC